MSFEIETRNPNNLPRILIIILLILVATTGLALLINRYFIQPGLTLKQPMTILLAGEDTSSTRFPSLDFLMLVFINPQEHRISLVSIPADTQANASQAEIRIKEAGAKDDIKYIEELVSGIIKTKIDRYVRVNFNGFQQLVDMMEGVEINVQETIRYTDRYGQLLSEITPGQQILNGEQALQYVRYLDFRGDINRIARQQAVLYAIMEKAIQSKNVFNSVKIYNRIQKNLKTDISAKEFLQLATFAKSINLSKGVHTYVLPGTPADKYWKPDSNEINRLIMKFKTIAK